MWLQEICNSCTSVFANIRAWEQQEWNKKKKTAEERKTKSVIMERSKAMWKKKSRLPITTQLKYSNSKHTLLVVFYKINKKINELTQNFMKFDLYYQLRIQISE